MLYDFFILVFFFSLTNARTDEVSTLHVSPPWDLSGNWKSSLYCPDNTWASGYNVFKDCESNGIVKVTFNCLNIQGTEQGSIQNSDNGDWSKSSWSFSYNKYCESSHFLVGFKAQGDCCNLFSNDLSMHELIMTCSSDTTMDPGGCNSGSWNSYQSCPSGSALCGYKYYFFDYASGTDNTAMEDIEGKCCKICSPTSSVYQSGTACNFCDMNCLTCVGSSSSCTSCGRSDTLSAQKCANDITLLKVSEEFKGTTTAAFNSDFTTYSWGGSTYSFYSMGTWYMLGKYGYEKYVTKTLSTLVPHYKARIKVRFYKIDNWNGESCKISIDGTDQSIPLLVGWQGLDKLHKLYYGDMNGANGYENTLFIDIEFTHIVPTMTIKFYSTLTSSTTTASWGISHFGLYVFRCHPTCKTCSGGSSDTQCLTCYDFATLQNSLCVCNDKYYAQTTSPCTTTICTICQPCAAGCNHCTGSGTTQCTSCYTGYYFYNNQCYQVCPTSPSKFGDPATLTCVDSCKADEYYNASRVCLKCDSNCYQCFGTATSCTACTGNLYLENSACTNMCSINNYGVLSSHTCQSDCEDYFFKHLVDRLCYQRCPSGFFGNVITKFCTASCPDGMYADPLTILCQYCQFNCQKCTGSATSCDSCKYTWLNSDATCSNPSYTKAIRSRLFITKPLTNADVTSTGFTVTGAATANYANTCASSSISYYVVGGPSSLSSGKISQTFTSLQAHFRARVTFFFLKIDNWQSNSVIVTADSVNIPTTVSFTGEDSSIMKLCGTSTMSEAVRPIDVIFNHDSSNLALEITTDLTVSPTVASWGIFDLSVLIDTCHSLCKTCNEATQFDCLSCNDQLFLQVSPGPSSCESLCPEGFYSDVNTNTCPPCSTSCKACSGPLNTNCLTCPSGNFLIISGTSFTCGTCPTGSWPDTTSGVCTSCDPSCLTCSAGTYKDCLTCIGTKYFYDNQCWAKCPDGTFGVNATMTCETSCPDNSFPYVGSNTCWPCNNCVKCVGIADNQCTVCSTGQFLEEGKCVNSCSLDHFVNPANSSCDICTNSCSNCSSLTTCSKCNGITYLRTPFNVSCTKCTDKGEIPNETTGICIVCDPNCDVCGSFTTCTKCEDGYYLMNSTNKCALQKSLQAVLKTSTDPTIVNLLFSDKWQSLMDLLNQRISLNITNHNKDEYTYVISQDSKIPQQIDIQFQFTKNIVMGDVLNLKIDFNDSTNDEFLLKNKEFALALSMYCVPPTIYQITAGNCVEPLLIVPSLQIISTDTHLMLKFSNDYGKIYAKYISRSTISIESFNQSSYNYTIQQSSSTDNFNIYLNFSFSFSNKPLLNLSLNPPSQILYDQSTNLRLSKYSIQINLIDYYALDSNTKSLIADANGATDSLNKATSNAFMANNFMSTGGSFAFRAMISMDVIRFLRFFLIDYPPNVLAMFQTSMPTSDFIPNVNLEESVLDGQLPDIFQSYSMSAYVFNNNGNILIEAFCYTSAGVVVLLLLKIFKNTKNRYFRMVLLIFRMVFVWNYGLSYFLSAFMNFALSTFLAYKYPTTQTTIGMFNFVFAIFDGLILLGIILFCFKIITKLRPHILFQKTSVIHPDPSTIHPDPLKVSGNEEKMKAKEYSFGQKNDPQEDLIMNDKNHSVLNDLRSTGKGSRIIGSRDGTRTSFENSSFSKEQNSPKKGDKKIMYFFPDNNNKSVFKKFKIPGNQNEMEMDKIILQDLDEIDKKGKDEVVEKKGEDILKIQKCVDESSPHLKDSNENLNKLDDPEPESARQVFSNDENPLSPKKNGFLPYIFRKINKGFGSQSSAAPFTFGDEEHKDNGNSASPTSAKETWFSKIKQKMKSTKKKKESGNDWREADNDEIAKFTQSLELLNKAFFPLHKDFNHSTTPQSYYILFDLLRQIVFSALVVSLFDNPLIGIILVNGINIGYLVCFLVIHPFKSKEDFIQNLLNEICLILCSISAFILVCMEKMGVNDMGLRMKVGWVMVGCNFFLIVVFLIRITISLSMMFYLLFRLLVKKIINSICKKKNQVHVGENEENESTRKKSEEGAVLQQIIEIENFLR